MAKHKYHVLHIRKEIWEGVKKKAATKFISAPECARNIILEEVREYIPELNKSPTAETGKFTGPPEDANLPEEF